MNTLLIASHIAGSVALSTLIIVVASLMIWLLVDNVIFSYELYRRDIVDIYGLAFDTIVSSLGILLTFSVIVSLIS